MYLRLLTIIIFVIPHLSSAATRTWEAFDYKNCHHWRITDDFLGDGQFFEKADKIAKNSATSITQSEWQVLAGNRLYEHAEYQYGVCLTPESPISCKPDTTFPLAGSTFIQVKRQTFKCAKGCEKVPFLVLYEMGYEDGGNSPDWKSATREFELRCHEKRRKIEFWRRETGR